MERILYILQKPVISTVTKKYKDAAAVAAIINNIHGSKLFQRFRAVH